MKNLSRIIVGLIITASIVGPIVARAQGFSPTSASVTTGTTLPASSGFTNPSSGTALPDTSTITNTPGLSSSGTANAYQSPSAAINPSSQLPTTSTTKDDIGCSFTGAQGLAICLSDLVYYPMVGLGSLFAYIAAFIFDVAVQFALTSSWYALDFIATTWTVARDVANMAFLFIVVYIGYKIIILGVEETGTLRMLVGVIIMALLVNFSFFLTRAMIDVGNIFAVQFYNAIQAPSINTTASTATSLGSGANVTSALGQGNAKDLTAAIMNGLQVQTIGGDSSFQSYVKNPNSSAMYTLITLSMIYIAMGIVFFILAGSFLYAAAKFIIRIVGLWGLIIASPLAFVAFVFRYTKFSFLKDAFGLWFTNLLRLTFYPAVYLFGFWILTILANEMGKGQILGGAFSTATVGQAATSGTFSLVALAIVNVCIRMGFFIAALYIILSVADKVSNYAGNAAGWFQTAALSGLAGGFIGGLGRGTLGLAGRGIRAGGNIYETTTGKKANAKLMGGANLLADRTYDMRNIPIVGKGAARGLGLVTTTADVASKTLKGGLPVNFGEAKKGKAWLGDVVKSVRGTAAATTAGAATVPAAAGATAAAPARPVPASTRAATPAAVTSAAASRTDITHGYSNEETNIKLKELSKALHQQTKDFRKFGDGGRSITNIQGDLSIPQQANNKDLKETLEGLKAAVKEMRNGNAQTLSPHVETNVKQGVESALRDELTRLNQSEPTPPTPPPSGGGTRAPAPQPQTDNVVRGPERWFNREQPDRERPAASTDINPDDTPPAAPGRRAAA